MKTSTEKAPRKKPATGTLMIDIRKARKLFRCWHRDEYVTERQMSDYADRLLTRLEVEARGSVWVVVQEGGTSDEVYLHSFDTEDDARRFERSCEKASYNVLAVDEVR